MHKADQVVGHLGEGLLHGLLVARVIVLVLVAVLLSSLLEQRAANGGAFKVEVQETRPAKLCGAGANTIQASPGATQSGGRN